MAESYDGKAIKGAELQAAFETIVTDFNGKQDDARLVEITKGTATYSDVLTLLQDGKVPWFRSGETLPDRLGSALLVFYAQTYNPLVIPQVVDQRSITFIAVNGDYMQAAYVLTPSGWSELMTIGLMESDRVKTSSDTSSWATDDTNVPTRAAVDGKISDALSGNVGGFMGVYSVSGINYLIAFTGYNFKNGDWFSMYDSGTITYYPNNDRSSSATISVSAGDDVYWTTSGVLLVRNMSAFATKSDLSKKAAGFTYELTSGKALKISLPWSTRTGRTSFLLHYPGNDNNYSMLQMSTFKGSSSVMEVPKVGVLSYSTKNSNSVPEIYYSRDSGSAQCIYISQSNNGNHVLTVMPTCENIESLVVEVVDRSEATGNTQSVLSRWSVFGPRGGTTAFTAKYDATGSSVDATPFSELVEAFDIYTDTIVLLYKYVSNGITCRRIYRMTAVQVDGNGNYSKFVFSRTNLGEESLENVGMQEIFSCTSSGWTMTTSDIFKSRMADFATQAAYYPNIDTPEAPISIRESMEARLVADTPTVRVPPEPASGERKTYLTSCLFTRLPDVSVYSNHIGTNVNYINLNDFMSWNTPSGLVKAGQVFAIWNTRSGDVRLYLGSSTSDDYMTVKAGRIGFVGTWDGMNFKLMTQ